MWGHAIGKAKKEEAPNIRYKKFKQILKAVDKVEKFKSIIQDGPY